MRGVLRVIHEELELPNDHILPDDALRAVLVSQDDEMAVPWLLAGLKVKLGVAITRDELQQHELNGTGTLQRFVENVLARMQACATGDS